MSRVILPAHAPLYLWTLTQTPDSFHVILDLPDDIDADSLILDISDTPPYAISCSVPNELPFLAGTAFGPILSVQRRFSDADFILVFTKAVASEWPQFITGPIADPFLIDPCSALRLAEGNGGDRTLLEFAVAANFAPALIFQADLLRRAGSNEESEALLARAADEYGDLKAACLLGMAFVKERRFAEAEARFREGAERGDNRCANCLGELYSPVEGEMTGLEDEGKAVEVFERILEREPGYPFALYNMAKLYLNACGVKKNVAKAKEMYVIAKGQEERIPALLYGGKDLAEYEEPVTLSSWLYLAVPLLIGGAFAVYRFVRRRRDVSL
jgi:tetratricopeptide (TPR) repeat protein